MPLPHPARRRRSPRHPGSLQRSLLALVLVPVVGLVGIMGYAVDEQADRATAAAGAADDVLAAVALDRVRAAVAQEVVPVLGQAVLSDPATATSVGVDAAGLASIAALARPALAAQLDSVQRATDDAVAAATGTGAVVPARRAAFAVAGLRSRSGPGGDLPGVFAGYQRVADQLTDQVAHLLQDARGEGMTSEGARTVADLQRVSRASALASVELPLYFASLRASAAERDGDRVAFLTAWGGYESASREVLVLGSPGTAASWAGATATAQAVLIDSRLRTAALAATPVVTPRDFLDLTTANSARDEALRGATTTTGTAAVAAAGEPAARASRTLWLLVAACALLVLLTLLAALLLRRWIAAPLSRLADQARAVSDGDLIDVDEGGPVEVRTVARGLAAAVDTLRRVRDQAQAVAAGELDSEVVRNPVHGPLGAVVHASVRRMVGALHERERLQAVLAHQASHDALTELPNRSHAQALTDAALHRAARRGGRVGLLFVDLDRFKSVNDTHGHAAGDELLRVVSGRMRSCLRGGDRVEGTVARLGGDEFVVLVEQLDDLAPAEAALVELGNRIIDAVCAPVELTGRDSGARVRVGASVGVAVSPLGAGSAGRLLQEADAAAYRAKAAGRGRVEVFDDVLRADLAHRTELEDALGRGLLAGELVLHYQPVLDLVTSRVTGVEALLRWERPGRGLVGPDEFVPVAEGSDLVCDLGRWALAEGVAQLARWDAEGGELAGIGVAVNVSGRHLAQPRLLGDVAVALAGSGIPPERLTLEITETVLVDEPTAREHLRALRALGVKVALDDFGTGYTSIGQLSRLPVDVLKIDRSFVASRDSAHADLVRLVIGAAHSFSLGVIAEGVEEEDQLAALLAAGCDAAQGFLLARPAPAAELSALAGVARG